MPYPGPAASCPCSINYADSIIVPSSPQPTHIGTNYAPTTSERLHIQANLVGAETDLAQLDSAPEHLKAAQERLQLKRSILRQYSTEHAALLSPIRRLPPEILAAIFMHLLPKTWATHRVDARRNRMLPSHICQHWRALALATPGLWANISVKIDGWNIDGKLECIKLWRARSGSCPLTVILSCPVLDQGRAIMKKLPNIVSYCVILRKTHNTDPVEEPYEDPPIRLVNLKHLSVIAGGEDSIPGFYEFLELPALSRYTYQEVGGRATRWKTSSLASLIARSSCVVTDIDISLQSAAVQDDLVLFLRNTPCLKSLYLRSYHARGTTSNNVLQALAIRSFEVDCEFDVDAAWASQHHIFTA
ncbi:hypothetical protein HWV62_37398 [Athelia sp. TMB]|nr:hypothetical protein HWV62_37398 [Athelia sp. TMB]